jgi:hypothetical protein
MLCREYTRRLRMQVLYSQITDPRDCPCKFSEDRIISTSSRPSCLERLGMLQQGREMPSRFDTFGPPAWLLPSAQVCGRRNARQRARNFGASTTLGWSRFELACTFKRRPGKRRPSSSTTLASVWGCNRIFGKGRREVRRKLTGVNRETATTW